MLELARLGVATRPGYAPATTSPRIQLFELEPHPVSSSEIRERVRRGEPIDGLVAPAVAATSPSTASTAPVDVRFAATLRALTSLEQARRIAALASEKLAEDVVILDMRPVCVYTDFFVLATGRNARQTKAIFDEVHAQLKQRGEAAPARRRRGGRRRSGSSPTTSTSSCTSSRPRRATSTGSRISGATCPPSTSKRRRPSYNPRDPGAIAQLGERLAGSQKVAGSSPAGSIVGAGQKSAGADF